LSNLSANLSGPVAPFSNVDPKLHALAPSQHPIFFAEGTVTAASARLGPFFYGFLSLFLGFDRAMEAGLYTFSTLGSDPSLAGFVPFRAVSSLVLRFQTCPIQARSSRCLLLSRGFIPVSKAHVPIQSSSFFLNWGPCFFCGRGVESLKSALLPLFLTVLQV